MTGAPPAAVEVASLYKAQDKIYPREVEGTFARLRTLAAWLLLGVYYGLAWLSWNGRQAVLFDLPARKFYIFGLTLWPQDFLYLTLLLIMAALSLFLFTALAGRLWCGYACPQTVWTEVFLAVERLAEGTRAQRQKLDRGPWNWNKVWRKGTKQVLWIALAAWTGYTFVGYFTPIRSLGPAILAGTPGPWETFWIVFYGFATYGNAGFLREQVCKYMCPYARFQGAMFDRDTLVISYDEARGEPRGARAKNADPRALGLGDCIDCTICVQVCPTGIDIRKGMQYECIACAACIDACDGVMDKVGYPRGLIRYTTQHAMTGGRTRLLRPRVFVYVGALAVIATGLVTSLVLRRPVGLDVIRDRNALYRLLPDGVVENVYNLRVINKDEQPHEFRFSVEPADALRVEERTVRVPGGTVLAVPTHVRTTAPGAVPGPTTITLRIEAADDARIAATSRARFFAPTAHHEEESHERHEN